MQLFQVIRWKNLVMIALVQGLIKYYLIPLFGVEPYLYNWQFGLMVTASIFIASGGYIINDIYDLKADKINKPDQVWIPNVMKIENAYRLYYATSLMGIVFGAILSISLKINFGLVCYLVPTLLLYYYAVRAKKMLVLSNLIVSSLIAFSLIIMLVFEKKILDTDNSFFNLENTIWVLAIFAFLINFVREIVKDEMDKEGDKLIDVISIPIRFGLSNTKVIIGILIGVIIAIVIMLGVKLYESQVLFIGYIVLAVLGSLFIFLIRLGKARTTKDFSKLSTYLKIIMIIGMMSVFMIRPF